MIGMAKRCRAAFLPVLAGLIVLPAYADMEPMGEDDMSNVSGQYGGMSLSGDISFNKNGGPVHYGGTRIAAQLSEGGGWFVLDDIQGTFAFEGLTVRTRSVSAGDFNGAVIEIGMPDTARFDDFGYTIATSTAASPGGQQNEIFSVEMGGEVTLDGNMLVIPLD
jgi:hypothetical protein